LQKVYDSLLNWSESKNKMAVNWIATAFTFVSKNPMEYRPNGTQTKPKDVDTWTNFVQDVSSRI
jgi:hypothetical protein